MKNLNTPPNIQASAICMDILNSNKARWVDAMDKVYVCEKSVLPYLKDKLTSALEKSDNLTSIRIHQALKNIDSVQAAYKSRQLNKVTL